MSEAPQKFTVERKELPQLDALEAGIEELYEEARNSDDLSAFETLYADVALFSEKLHNLFSKEELLQVPAYHRLIRSGIPDSGQALEAGVDLHRKEEIESAILDFTKQMLLKFRTH